MKLFLVHFITNPDVHHMRVCMNLLVQNMSFSHHSNNTPIHMHRYIYHFPALYANIALYHYLVFKVSALWKIS